MGRSTHPSDPRGLIREAYRIERITPAECRSIFLDWVIGLPDQMPLRPAIESLLVEYGAATDHPMTQVLRDGLVDGALPRRRGGRAGRVKS